MRASWPAAIGRGSAIRLPCARAAIRSAQLFWGRPLHQPTLAFRAPQPRRQRRIWRCVVVAVAVLTGTVQAVQPRQELQLTGHRFDPLLDTVRAASMATVDSAGRGLRLVQLHGPIEQRHLDALSAAGLRLLQYYPEGFYLTWGDQAALHRAAQASDVRWVGDFSVDWRLSSELTRATGTQRLIVHYVDNGQAGGIVPQLRLLGADVEQDYPAQADGRFREAVVSLDSDRLAAVAALPQVLWVGRQNRQALRDDEMSAQIVAGNLDVNGVPEVGYLPFLGSLGLAGEGLVWSVIDDGVDQGHPDFAGRIAGGFDYLGCASDGPPGSDGPSGGHGSHVAGILAGNAAGGFGDASGFAYGLGQAPAVRLYSQNALCGPGASWPPIGGWSVLSQHALAGGAVGANASWTTSEGARHGYQASERLFDQMVRDGDFSSTEIAEALALVFSAGNSGPQPATMTSPKEAKNIISVGATLNHRAGPSNRLADYSSRGPAVDGRLLPTLVAPGTEIASTRRRAGGAFCNLPIPGTAELYAYCLGSSMAAPHVSGLAVLLTQWWRAQHGGANPSPAMLKALLITGARPLDPGDIAPDDQQGWGLAGLPPMLTDATLGWQGMDQSQLLDEPGSVHRLAVRVLDTQRPLTLTLVWTDAPGAIDASPALVNDLDLEVLADDQLFRGNVFGAAGSLPGGAADRLNNVERIILEQPPARALVRIRGHALPADGVPLQGDQTDQDYALLCTNCAWDSDFDVAEISGPAAACTPDPAQFDIDLVAVGTPTLPLQASPGDLPIGLQVAVQPTELLSLPGQLQVHVDTAAATGSGPLSIPLLLEAGGQQREVHLPLKLAQQTPLGTQLERPEDAATGQALEPTLLWSDDGNATRFRLQLDDDADFSSPLVDVELSQPEYQLTTPLPAHSQFHWRVLPANACGQGLATPSRRFRTGSAPGSCPPGQKAMPMLHEQISTAASGWEHYALLGSDRWQVSEQRSLSPAHSYHGENGFGRSDQRLLSPRWLLPAGEAAFLRFQLWLDIEQRDSERCWDGLSLHLAGSGTGLVDLHPTQFLIGAPTQHLSEGNPAAGQLAWCGQQEFSPVLVDLGPQAGSGGRAALRLVSDGLVAREGAYIDDLELYSCVDDDVLFRNGLGAEAR